MRQSGGDPTDKEMVIVNKEAMIYYIEKLIAQEKITENLRKDVKKLEQDKTTMEYKVGFLSCLEACGVDNWDGFSDAHEMMDES
jgi:hypothetical protein